MTVFKGYMTLWRRDLKLTILYLMIFFGITLAMQQIMVKQNERNYETEEVDIAVFNQDDSVLAKGLYEYLNENHHIVKIENKKNEIQEALYYQVVEYVVTIPEGFEADYLEHGKKLETTKKPDSILSEYLDAQIDTFLNSIRVYAASGYSIEEAVEHTLKQNEIKAEVTMVDQNGNGGVQEPFVYFFQYFPYMIIAVLGYGGSTLLIRFRKKEIHQRMLCSSVSLLRQNICGGMAFLMVGSGIWIFTIACMILIYGKTFLTNANRWYFLANSVTITLSALGIAFLLGIVVREEDSLTGIVNVLSLGLSFLCGVFVPLEMLGSGVKKISQFLPVYWFETINGILGSYNHFSSAMKETIYKGFAIQLGFGFACMCVALMISKMRQQEN